MKVLFVSSLPSSFSDQSSAYLHRLITLKKSLETFGVKTDLLYLADFYFSKPGLIHPLNITTILRHVRGYDLIHAGGGGAAYTMGIARHFYDGNFKLIYDVHGNIVEENRLLKKNMFNLKFKYMVLQASIMEKIAISKSDYFAVCSQSLRDHYILNGIDDSKIEVIPNGADIRLFKSSILGCNKNKKKFIVTYAGRFQKNQGMDLLMGAISLLKNEDISFRIVGFQKKDQSLMESIKIKFNNNVELIPDVPREELVNYLSSSDILVITIPNHPSLRFSFPTKFAEYISCSVPVIATNVSEISEITRNHQCGFVCDTTPESLANTIIKARKMKPEELFEMGLRGRRLAETDLNSKSIGEKYFKFLTRILEG